MRHALAALLTVTFLPSIALAGPITAGVNLGLAQSKLDGDAGVDPHRSIGLFGRLGFNPRLSGQLELSRLDTDGTGVEVHKATALLVVDLGARGNLVPTLLAGIGLDQATGLYGDVTEAHHIEGGFGLEYRAAGGLTIGAEVRLGGRTLHEPTYEAQPVYDGVPRHGYDDCGYGCGTGVTYAPTTLREGEYRVARITVGVRF